MTRSVLFKNINRELREILQWPKVVLCLAIIFIYAFSLLYRGFDLTMSPFRESQTAITIYYFDSLSIDNFLHYLTPVLGPPWRVPFEFPVFQALAALGSHGRELGDLILIAKSLSLLFFIATLYVLRQTLLKLGAGADACNFMVLCVSISPIYVSYSSALLIEATVLFFAFCGLYCYLVSLDRGWIFLAFALAFFSLASVTKITTWFTFAMILISFSIMKVYSGYISGLNYRDVALKKLRRPLFHALTCIFFSGFVGLLWTSHADTVKSLSPLSIQYTSDSLSAWNFGTVDQRLSSVFWTVSGIKFFLLSLGFYLPFYVLKYKKIISGTDAVFTYLTLCCVAAIVTFLIFQNLFYRHDYYYFSISWAVVAAIAYIVFFMRWRYHRYILVGAMLFSSVTYLTLKKNYYAVSDYAAIDVTKKLPNYSPIIVLGRGFSSYIPFMTERRALMDGSSLSLPSTDSDDLEILKTPWEAIIFPKVLEKQVDMLSGLLGRGFNNRHEYYPGHVIATDGPLDKSMVNLPYRLTQAIREYRASCSMLPEEPKASDSLFLECIDVSIFGTDGLNPTIRFAVRRGSDIFYVDFLRPIILRF